MTLWSAVSQPHEQPQFFHYNYLEICILYSKFLYFCRRKNSINRLMEYAFPAYFESKFESALFCGRPNCCDANVCGGRLYSLMRHGRHSNPSGSGAFFMPFFGLFRRPTTPPQPPRECPKSVALQTFARFRDDIGKPSSPSFTSFPYRLEHIHLGIRAQADVLFEGGQVLVS